ncbi:hypothetical protein Tco_0177723, partial [Tanacetum coccineum]
TGLDEFVNKHVVENCKAMSSEEEPKVVKKYNDAPMIEEWVSDDEEEDVSRLKIEKKIVRPSIVKKEFYGKLEGGLNILLLFILRFMFVCKNLDSTLCEFNACTI